MTLESGECKTCETDEHVEKDGNEYVCENCGSRWSEYGT